MAWLAFVESGECSIEHGKLVEAHSRFFVEGVWNGPFAAGRFDACESFFGSGAVVRSDGIVFVPSSATVDYLYYRVEPARVVCSNSLPYLLAAIGDRLDPGDTSLARVNDSIMHGIDRYERGVPTVAGSVRRLMHHNLVVRGISASEEVKPFPPGFASFRSYRDYLEETLGGMIANARDPGRRTPLRVLTTQSIGYDSTATNALATKHGIDLALSVSEPKEVLGYYGSKRRTDSDSGAGICRILGLDMAEIDRRYFEREPESEYLYWAGIHNCQDMNLHQVAQYTKEGAVLLTGVLGEIWYTSTAIGPNRLSCVNDQVERWDLSCHGLSEARLHAGWVHAAVPYIGARRRKDIFLISNSDEMKPWSIGGTYDRPIARRIAEEAGVPREAFGQKKLATVVEVLPPYLPHGVLRQEFFTFMRKAFGPLAPTKMRMAQRLNYPLMIVCRAYDKARRLLYDRLSSGKPVTPTRWRLSESRKAALYAYCVNNAAESYAVWRTFCR